MALNSLPMPRAYISVYTRRVIIARAHGRCEYCKNRADFATETFPVDHVVSISRGGTNELENLALACSRCNGHKYNKQTATDPITRETVPLFSPRQQQWHEHFCWSEDYAHIIGLTPTGRATVQTLQMNHVNSVNIRKILYLSGKHPPKDAE